LSESLTTIDELVAEFPRQARMLEAGEPLEWLWHYDLDAVPAKLWVHLIDTSRFNRALKLGRMEFEERDGVLHGWGKNGGFLQEWIEHPWDWVAGQYLVSTREYSRGFAQFVRVIYRIEKRGDGLRLYVYEFEGLGRSEPGMPVRSIRSDRLLRPLSRLSAEEHFRRDGSRKSAHRWNSSGLRDGVQEGWYRDGSKKYVYEYRRGGLQSAAEWGRDGSSREPQPDRRFK
jgi:hypothetical protein